MEKVGTRPYNENVRARVERPDQQSDLLDLAFDAIFVRSFHERVITYWNRGAELLYGYPREQVLGRPVAEVLRSEYPVAIEEIEAQLRRTGRWEGELIHHSRDGRRLVVSGRWALQTDTEGEPLAIFEINSDITEEKAAGEELTRTDELFRLLVSSVVDYAIFMLDTQGRITTWNEGAQRINGYQEAEVLGRNFSIFYPEEDVRAGKPSWELVVAEREGRYEEEGWRICKDGSRIWASVVITALRDAAGELRGFSKVTRDLTRRKREQDRQEEERRREAAKLRAHAERMAQLERAKAEFLNLASHELRGPLTVVRGYISMMEDGSIPPSQMQQISPLLSAKLAQMELLIQQMLETARLEHDSLHIRPDLVDLAEVVREQIQTFRPLARDHRLELWVDGSAVQARGDRARIGTIIANLIDNAIKYSPAGGDIDVAVAGNGEHVFASIRDHGIGIRREDVANLFSRFGRLPTEENRSISGTGLGLFLSREIARRHGGEILVESWPGAGSRFTLSLPRAEP